MKDRNVFSRSDVLRANDSLRKNLSSQSGTRGERTGGARLSSQEINRAFAAAKKTLAAA